MRVIVIKRNEAGQRMSKFLLKYFDKAPASFVYKMLRKKNIVLGGAKADGSEILSEGSEIKLFLSEETIASFRSAESGAEGEVRAAGHKMSGSGSSDPSISGKSVKGKEFPSLRRELIVYEDEDILVFNKPFGMLSQRAGKDDHSAVELLIGYLLETGVITVTDLETFRPSVCNRLDRNTSGLVIAGKSLMGLKTMTGLIKERKIGKYYRCIVKGEAEDGLHILKGYLLKDEEKNLVRVSKTRRTQGDEEIETRYRTLGHMKGYSLLEAEPVTGKTHQIRAHLASEGLFVVGDTKYGDRETNRIFKDDCGLDHQLLSAVRLEFPSMPEDFERLSGRVIEIEEPKEFEAVKDVIRKL